MAIGEIEFSKFFNRSEHLDKDDIVDIEIKVRMPDAEHVVIVIDCRNNDTLNTISIDEITIPINQLDFVIKSLSLINDLNKSKKAVEFFKTI